MRVKELKQWQLFRNTNNYLCLAYRTTGNVVGIVNYNGTFYNAKKDSSYEYSDEIPQETVEEFFNNFPMEKLDYYKDRDRLLRIKSTYFIEKGEDLRAKKLRLLLL